MSKLNKKNSYEIRGRIWIENENQPFIGLGRVELLKKIKEFGSITQAAKAMKMSYRQAWEMIDSINSRSKTPLVIKQSGGKHGGGAILTEAGEKVIVVFTNLRNDFFEFLETKSNELNM